MRLNRTLALSGLALVLAAGFTIGSRPATGDQGDADGVAASCKAFKQAWNAHDAKALSAVFSDDNDATHIDPMGKVDEGKAAITSTLTSMFGPTGPMRESTLVVNTEVVRFPTPDTAISDADATVSGAYGPDGAKAPPMNLHVVNVWKKVGGNWRVFACRPTRTPSRLPRSDAIRLVSYTIDRTFSVPPARLFRAFTTPDGLAAWAWGAQARDVRAQVDLRPGGALEVTAAAPKAGASRMGYRGIFVEVVPDRRLVETVHWDSDVGYNAPGMHPVDEVMVIEFSADPAGSRLVLTHHGIPDDGHSAAAHEGGVRATLDDLARYLAASPR